MSKKYVQELIGIIFSSRDFAHKKHLMSESYSQHMALGSFYVDVIAIGDKFVEAWQGRNLELIDDIPIYKTPIDSDALKVLQKHLTLIEECRDESAGKDTALQNIIDELVALYLSTIYKLKFLK